MHDIDSNWTGEDRRKTSAHDSSYEGENRRREDSALALLIQKAVKHAVSEAVESHPLSPDEVHWVRMAIQAEAERAQYRKAIIEKSLAGLVWIGIIAVGSWLIDYVVAHWK